MKSVTIVSDDRVGLLADISYILGKSNINIDGLYVDVIGGKAVISLQIKDPRRAIEVLENNGFKATNPEAIVIKVPHGSVGEITEMLESEKVNVTDLSTLSKDSQDTIFALSVDKPRKANKMLSTFILGNSVTPSYY